MINNNSVIDGIEMAAKFSINYVNPAQICRYADENLYNLENFISLHVLDSFGSIDLSGNGLATIALIVCSS